MFTDPCHASQMTVAFTQHHACQQSLEEAQRAADAEHIVNIEKAKHHVIIYAWVKDNIEATVLEVQGGFKWPHFMLTPAILLDVDLLLADETEGSFKLYNAVIRTWMKVRIGHVITLKDCNHIFLKGHNVIQCHNFDNLHSLSQGSAPHFSKNLPCERAYI
ncbi:hypothetical protein L208DRAFT_1271279 [Tricholoma matsutake]|nr:hypothetical protein L208DRAFT_1271279 [Tricholoma matsutake 945]